MSSDPSFSDVRLLLHMNGDDDGTTFTDVIGKTITRAGNAVTKTGNKKYGSASAYFDGSGDYLSFSPGSSMDMGGNSDFTIEAWINLSSIPAFNTYWSIISSSNTPYPDYFFAVYGAGSGQIKLDLHYTNSGGSWLNAATSALTLNTGQWYHVAVCRDGSTLRFFIDGAKIGSDIAFNVTFRGATSAAWRIGDLLHGYVDDLRATIGAGRYTENFTPPEEEFPDSAAIFADLLASLGWSLAVPVIAGTITEDTAFTDWRVRALRLTDGALVGELDVTGSSYDLGVTTLAPVMVSCMPRIDAQWSAGGAFSADDYAIASDPVTVPYIYRCAESGTSGSSEPEWPTTPEATVEDGTVTWECVGRMVQPLIHGPLMP